MNNLYANRRIRIQSEVVTHIKRHLPSATSKIQVSVGQEVVPTDILGEGQPATGFRTIHLARDLRVSLKRALSFLKREMGKTIYQGELLASREELLGLRKRFLLSPVDGIIDFYDQEKGNLRIKLLPKISKIASGVYGIVDHIDSNTGQVTIRTTATIIHGLFGSGKEREGILHVLDSAQTLVSSNQITEQMHGRILVGGAIVFLEALEKMINTNTFGIITGGINSKDYKAMVGGDWNFSQRHWSDVGLTLMVTEGFGAISMGEDIFSILTKFDNRFVILDGNRSRLILPSGDQNSIINIRRVALPLDGRPEPEPEVSGFPLEIGLNVRLIAGPYMGQQGKVEAIDRSPTKLPSRIVTYLVTVGTSSQKIRVPYLNLEIIE